MVWKILPSVQLKFLHTVFPEHPVQERFIECPVKDFLEHPAQERIVEGALRWPLQGVKGKLQEMSLK